jgi:hypothetical protein
MSSIQAITYEDALAVTLSDTTADPALGGGQFAGFYVGGSGTVKFQSVRGTTVTLVGAQAGTIYPFACTRIWSTGTTATSILGLVALPYKPMATAGLGVVLP